MIELRLKSGKDILVTLVRKDNNIYELVDENNQMHLELEYNDNRIIFINNNDIDETNNSLESKLYPSFHKIFNQDFYGIEYDDIDYTEEESDPFDPEEISIETRVITMETCLRRLEQGTLMLNPDFQRNYVWTDDKKSQLIESLMLKIPIPMFYVSSDEKGNYTVVDGLQRLSTIRDFALGKEYSKTNNPADKGNGFKLKKLEFWKEYEDCRLIDLPNHIYNRIVETEFTFTVINPGTPEEVRRNIFKRLNTGGMPLSSQEIRNALYIGKATTLLNDLSKELIFTQATCNSIKSQRMEDKELILRFISFIVRDYSTYNKTINVDTWLSDTMIIINSSPNFDTRELKKSIKSGTVILSQISNKNINSIKERFINAMSRTHELFKDHAFRKSYGQNRRAPINKSLFETWGVLLSDLSESEYQSLKKNKNNFMSQYKQILQDPYFIITISRDSMKHYAVKHRFDTLSNLIKTHLS